MTNKFENMNVKEVVEYFHNAKDASFKDEIKNIDSLDAMRRSGIIDALEKETVTFLKGDARDFKLFGASPYSNMEKSVDFLGDFLKEFMTEEDKKKFAKETKELAGEIEKENAESLADYQDLCHLIHYIAKTKGKAAHPVIKEVAKNLAALPNTDYNSLDKLRDTLAKAYNTAAASTPQTPNPFKKGPYVPRI